MGAFVPVGAPPWVSPANRSHFLQMVESGGLRAYIAVLEQAIDSLEMRNSARRRPRRRPKLDLEKDGHAITPKGVQTWLKHAKEIIEEDWLSLAKENLAEAKTHLSDFLAARTLRKCQAVACCLAASICDTAFYFGRAKESMPADSRRKEFADVLVAEAVVRIMTDRKRRILLRKFPMIEEVVKNIDSWSKSMPAAGHPTGVFVHLPPKSQSWDSGRLICLNPEYGIGEIGLAKLEKILVRERKLWAAMGSMRTPLA